MGEEWPFPGSEIFQRIFFVSLHSMGGCASGEAPVASGPRHCIQADDPSGLQVGPPFSARAVKIETKQRIRVRVFIIDAARALDFSSLNSAEAEQAVMALIRRFTDSAEKNKSLRSRAKNIKTIDPTMELAKFAPGDIRLLSVEGQKVRVLLTDDRVFDLHYPSFGALDHDLREWASRAGYSVERLLAKGENDINGFGP